MYEVDEKKFRILIEAVKRREPEKFNFGEVVADYEVQRGGRVCGTVCCAIGMTPEVFPDEVQWTGSALIGPIRLSMDGCGLYFHRVAEKLFGIERDLAYCLFSPGLEFLHAELPLCTEEASPAEVAEMMEKFIELVEAGEIEEHKIK